MCAPRVASRRAATHFDAMCAEFSLRVDILLRDDVVCTLAEVDVIRLRRVLGVLGKSLLKTKSALPSAIGVLPNKIVDFYSAMFISRPP